MRTGGTSRALTAALMVCALLAAGALVTSCGKSHKRSTPTSPGADTDGDGIADDDDQCPTLPGESQYGGCPWWKADVCSGVTIYTSSGNRWSNSTPRYFYDSSLPTGWRPYADQGAAAWNQVGTRLQISPLGSVVTAGVGLDGKNVVCYGPISTGILGKTYSWYNTTTHYFVEADIILNSDERLAVDTYTNGAGPADYDVYSVLTHEFGHFAGLDHVTDRTHTMYPSTPPDCVIYRTLCNGDVQGLRTLYP
jgi:hypothetical protein